MLHRKVGFTLVELIVVITILAILGTIASISLQGFSRDARDSTRISDINNIQKSLTFYATAEGGYLLPDNSSEITYSGALVWTQGTFSDGLVRKLQKISQKPVDPLTGDEYSYSVLRGKQEIQVGGILEGEISSLPLVSNSYAAGRVGNAYIKGDYNGKLAKTASGSTTFILAVPTIISGDISLLDLEALIASQKLVYHDAHTVPASFDGNEFDTSQVLDFTPDNILVFSGDIEDMQDLSNQIEFVENVKQAYSGFTLIRRDGAIDQLITEPIDPSDPSPEVKSIANLLLKEVVGYDAPDYTNVATSPCFLSSEDVAELNDFFDYSGSSLQYATAQEWCDLTAVSVNGQGIGKDLPNAIGKLEGLTWLSLNSNGITGTLPSGLGDNLSNLTFLSIYANNLTGSIPSNFGNLSQLQTLRLYGNDLSGNLPPEIGNISTLESLGLTDNNFTGSIPDNYGNLSLLESLTLRDNNLTGSIPSSLANLSSLTWFDVAQNGLTGGLPTNLGNINTLTHIYIYSNDLDQLPDSLTNLTNLQAFQAFGNSSLGNLSNSFNSGSAAASQTNITETGKEMTISGNGTTIDIQVN